MTASPAFRPSSTTQSSPTPLPTLIWPWARVLGLGQREAHPDRVGLREGGEQARIRARRDQAADRLLSAAGDAGDRGVHRRIGEIELGLAHARLGQLRRGDRLLQAGRRLVGFPLADRAPVGKTLQALEILLRPLLARRLLRERGARLLQIAPERHPLDATHPRAALDRT